MAPRSTYPKKLTHASVEYVDLGAIGQEALKESGYLGHLRQVDAIAHVVRAFEDDSVPHAGPIEPLRDIKNVEFDLMVSDLGQIEKRLERLEKDLKKMRSPDLEKEFELMKAAKSHLESERPLREMQMTPEDKKRLRGFMFLSEKPILYVLNVNESAQLGNTLANAASMHKLAEVASRPNAAVAAICGKVEAELAEMNDADAAEFLASYGLQESGLVRLIRSTYNLLGMISFFTVGKMNVVPGQFPPTPGLCKPLALSTPIWRSISFAPRPFAGTSCWMPDQKPMPAPVAHCVLKARTTSYRTVM